MKWRKIIEYKTSLTVNDEEFHIIARKDAGDDYFAVNVNGEYIADCEEVPTREFLEHIIREDEEIARRVGQDSFRIA